MRAGGQAAAIPCRATAGGSICLSRFAAWRGKNSPVEVPEMQILVGWDDPTQAELLSLYLDVEENTVRITATAGELLGAAAEGGWDVVLMSLRFPDPDTGFDTFLKVRQMLPASPVVGVCDSEDTFQLARFISAGLRSHVMRDAGGDFVFLLPQTLQSAVEAVRAEHDQKLAERLREEIDSVRKLQESIIPKNLFTPQGYGLAARYEPSQISVMGGRAVVMAGGDYYDVFSLDDEHLVILLGDASGHGMKACMSIMTMHTLVRMIRGKEYSNTAQFVFEINQRLCEQGVVTDEGGFITLLYAVLNPATNALQWTSAGHPLPMIHRVETVPLRWWARTKTPICPWASIPRSSTKATRPSSPDTPARCFIPTGWPRPFPPTKITSSSASKASRRCWWKTPAPAWRRPCRPYSTPPTTLPRGPAATTTPPWCS
jgi:CheY-like chemotaxis protein